MASGAIKLLGNPPAPDRLAIWRYAVDAAVNDVLEQSGLPCPDEGVTPAKLGLPRNLTAEQYFNLLAERAAEQEKEQKQEQGKGQRMRKTQQKACQKTRKTKSKTTAKKDEAEDDKQEDDSGSEEDGRKMADKGTEPGRSGGRKPIRAKLPRKEGKSAENPGGNRRFMLPMVNRDRGKMARQVKNIPACKSMSKTLIEAATAKAIEDYQEQRGRGSVPGGLARQAADKLHPRIDPARELLAKIKYAVGSTSGFGAFTYQKPNRRQPRGGALLPAHVKPIPKIIVAVDSSGSMGAKDIALAMGIISNALRSIPDPRGVSVWLAIRKYNRPRVSSVPSK